MRGCGTDEPWFYEDMSGEMGERAVAAHFRKPLSIVEVNQMAPIPEVRARPGRP
jgi:hypothetical protein